MQFLKRLFAPIKPGLSESATMQHAECQALRQLLHLTQAEAAQTVAKVSVRSWQYWESGARAVPEDVATLLRQLALERTESVGIAVQWLAQHPQHNVAVWYAGCNEWRWRMTAKDAPWARNLHSSVVAELLGRQLIRVVAFDEAAYAAWCKVHAPKPVHSEAEAGLHLRWAAQRMDSSPLAA